VEIAASTCKAINITAAVAVLSVTIWWMNFAVKGNVTLSTAMTAIAVAVGMLA
jgi:hypothetical protein